MKPDYKDHKTAKPTKKEAELMKSMMRLQNNFQIVVANMRAQVRAICIANNISPELFVKSFHDSEKQTQFEVEQIRLETDMMAKAQLDAQKAREELKSQLPQMPEQLKDMLEGEADNL